ncbi:hypothetical protein BD289DRAFT_440269 [Coniella lustricola]|uniref:Uncharacterized protein n=1 Tax=Coniella lustricola TaxID=2025994 RepID=A0A2T3A0W8_9PEZI|nr:hypothetical protein BD289DRAFT_440269 [Coniella lustricola]
MLGPQPGTRHTRQEPQGPGLDIKPDYSSSVRYHRSCWSRLSARIDPSLSFALALFGGCCMDITFQKSDILVCLVSSIQQHVCVVPGSQGLISCLSMFSSLPNVGVCKRCWQRKVQRQQARSSKKMGRYFLDLHTRMMAGPNSTRIARMYPSKQ